MIDLSFKCHKFKRLNLSLSFSYQKLKPVLKSGASVPTFIDNNYVFLDNKLENKPTISLMLSIIPRRFLVARHNVSNIPVV